MIQENEVNNNLELTQKDLLDEVKDELIPIEPKDEKPNEDEKPKTTKKESKNKSKEAILEVEVKNIAIPLEDFEMPIPMPGQGRFNGAFCTVSFKKDRVISDPYTVEYLRTSGKPLRFE